MIRIKPSPNLQQQFEQGLATSDGNGVKILTRGYNGMPQLLYVHGLVTETLDCVHKISYRDAVAKPPSVDLSDTIPCKWYCSCGKPLGPIYNVSKTVQQARALTDIVLSHEEQRKINKDQDEDPIITRGPVAPLAQQLGLVKPKKPWRK